MLIYLKQTNLIVHHKPPAVSLFAARGHANLQSKHVTGSTARWRCSASQHYILRCYFNTNHFLLSNGVHVRQSYSKHWTIFSENELIETLVQRLVQGKHIFLIYYPIIYRCEHYSAREFVQGQRP